MHLTASKELANISLKCCLLGYFTLYFFPAAILKAHRSNFLRPLVSRLPIKFLGGIGRGYWGWGPNIFDNMVVSLFSTIVQSNFQRYNGQLDVALC